MSVVAGARRPAHSGWLRQDDALHAMPGIPRFPGTDTVRNFFRRFRQRHVEAFRRPLWKWLLELSRKVPLVLHAWLRSGNTGSARGVTAFLSEALALPPASWKLRTIRADSGFFVTIQVIKKD